MKIYLYFLALLVYSFTESAWAQIEGTCEPYNVTGSGVDICGSVLMQRGYSLVFSYPSTTQAEFNSYLQDINTYSSLIPSTCLPVLLNFVCGNAFPKCLELPSSSDPKVVTLQPFCRSSCDYFETDCAALLTPFVLNLLPHIIQDWLNCTDVSPIDGRPIYPPLYVPWTFPENPGILVYCEGKVPPPPIAPVPQPKVSYPLICGPFPLPRPKIGLPYWVC